MSQKYLPSTSRDLDPTNYAWDSIVYQAGRPMLDSELNLTQDILNKKNTLPSGMISYQGQDDTIGSFSFEDPYTGDPLVLNADFIANGFVINPFKAMVNGMVIDVRNTDATDGTNKITLDAPTPGVGAGDRGDFVFLEVWRREVTPAMQAKSRIKVLAPQANDTFTVQINGQTNPPPHADTKVLTAVGGAPGANEFQIGATPAETARNIAQAINDYDGAGLGLTVGGITTFTETRGTQYVFLDHNGGTSGNYDGGDPDSFNLASSDNASILVLSQPAGGSDGEGKPNANKVYFAGNVDSPSGVWLDDKIQDPNVNVSSTRRIQVQYRLRSYKNDNIPDQIFGFENTDVLAQGSTGSPVATYTFSRHTTDTGLWYAGAGLEEDATALGTVDGYVYAIPICYVFRRWSAANAGISGFNALGAFNTGTNHDHDGVTLGANDYVDNVAVKESDRPDGLFADQISEYDVLDLRRRVYPRGLDFSAELDYQYHSLLDDTNKTWYARAHNLQDTGNGSGGISHTPLVCDAYGKDDANIAGEGQWRQNFDHIARRWSNEPTTERIYIIAKPSNTVAQPSTGISVSHAGGTGDYWYEGDQITIDLTTLDISGHLGWDTNNGDFLPADDNTISPKLIDIGYCWHNDGHFTNAIEQQVYIQNISGLGSNQVVITLNANPVVANGGTQAGADYFLVGDATNGESAGNREIFIELIFDYPSIDRGLSGTVAETLMPDPSGYPTGAAVLTELPPTNAYDPYPGQGNGNAPPISNAIPNTKEVSLEYVYAQETIQIISGSPTNSYLPWRLYFNSNLAPTITDQSGVGTTLTLDNANTNYQHAESKIGWTNSGVAWNAGQRLIEVTAYPLEPYPSAPTDSTIFVYYRRYAPKTVGADFAINAPNVGVDAGGVIPDELNLQPLVIGKEIGAYLKTSEHYPFFNPTDQLATHFNASNYEEYKTLGSPEVILDDLKINTGSIKLPSFVPFVSSVNVALGDTGVNQPPRKDNEGRAYYPTMEDSSYFPSAFAKNMGGTHSNYKTTLPCLMKIVDDNHVLYRKGEVVLVVFVKTNEWGQGVAVDMREESLADNYVAACVYRTRNQLLLGE